MSKTESITGRDDFIISQALYIAARTLRSDGNRQSSNADDMEAISKALFPGTFEQLSVIDRIRDGRRMGIEWVPGSGFSLETVEAWIAAGLKPIAEIGTDDVMARFSPIWTAKAVPT